MSTFATRFVKSTTLVQQQIKEDPEGIAAHLTGIFLSIDTDGDGFISKTQLVQALGNVGLLPREALLKKFVDAQLASSSRRASTVSPTRRGTALPQAAGVKFDLITFVKVCLSETDKIKLAGREIDPLLNFMTVDNKTERITVNQIRHLLVDTLSPARLDEREFQTFLSALGVPPSSIKSPNDEAISVSDLKKKLLLVSS
jgi:hypothetical protein